MNTEELCFFRCFIFILLFKICAANHCAPSSCGNILNISYPFRLTSDPQGCGNSSYELSCENNSPVIHLKGVGKFNVKSIDYHHYTLRLADPAVDERDCSTIPSIPVSDGIVSKSISNLYSTGRRADSNVVYLDGVVEKTRTIIFVKCRDPVNSPAYVDRSPCFNGVNSSLDKKFYNYAYLGELNFEDLAENCSIEMVSVLPIRASMKKMASFVEIHKEMAYGFELYWFISDCVRLNCSRGCSLNPNNTVDCFIHVSAGAFESVRYAIQEVCFTIEQLYRDQLNFNYELYLIKTDLQEDKVHPLYHITYVFVHLVYLAGVFLILRNVCCAPLVFSFLMYKWRRRHLSDYKSIEEFLESQNNLMPIRYKFSDIKKMTNGFKDKLGKGGFGSVYKGKLRSGQLVAIKMLENPKADGQDFINEVATVGRIHHANIVQLVGFCCERSKFALVYEFMPNGSLDNHMNSRKGANLLSWEKLHEISIGVACGIEYLHQGCEMQILHFDIKPHNVLLDEMFMPKLSDFGLAKFHKGRDNDVTYTAAKGTIGYMAPELFYKNIGGVSYKADVYSFGMLLLEMTGKRKNLSTLLDESGQSFYSNWVYEQLFDDKFTLEDATKEENKIARKLIIVGLWCIQMQPSNRPPMEKVVEMLEADLESLQIPPRPLLYPTESTQPSSSISHDFTESYCFNENDISDAVSRSLIKNKVD